MVCRRSCGVFMLISIKMNADRFVETMQQMVMITCFILVEIEMELRIIPYPLLCV